VRRTTFDHEPDGLKRRLQDLERSVADLLRVREGPPQYVEVEAGGSIPFLVAAADAPDEWKAVAAYQCDHTDDAATVQAAIGDASQHTVTLSPGTFYGPNGGITLGTDQNLEGAGAGSILYFDGSAVIAGGRSIIRRLTFSYYSVLTGTIGVDADTNNGEFTVEDCWFTDSETGLHLRSCNGATVRRCDFSGLDTVGIVDTNASRCRVESCRFDGADAMTVAGFNWIISDNHFVNGDVQIDGDENLLVGNQIISGATVTIGASAGATAFVSNFMEQGATDYTDGGTGTQKPTNGNFSSGGLW
jgi:hypothetical protein